VSLVSWPEPVLTEQPANSTTESRARIACDRTTSPTNSKAALPR